MYQSSLTLKIDLKLPITEWLTDETFYSLCCRFHYISNNAVAGTTARQLFGHPRHGTQHDFASRINVFVQRTQGYFGAAAQDIIYEHTILPFYLSWRSENQAGIIMQQLCTGNAGSIKGLLGLPSSRIRANHPLKFCHSCMLSDRQRFGVAYWHLTHQLPGVWICPTHACWLMQSMHKATGVGRFLWYLPHDGDFYPPPATLESTDSYQWLKRLANAAMAAFKLSPGLHIDQCKLVSAYRHALQERGLLRGYVQVSLKETAQQYLKFAQALNFNGLDIPIPANQEQAKLHLSRLLACPQHSTHPLRHLLFIVWLFEDWGRFWDVYTHAEPYHHPDSNARVLTPVQDHTDPRTEKLLFLVQNKGVAVSTAARQIGIAVQTAQAWVSAQGVCILRRNQMPAQHLKAILKDLRQGKEKTATAHKYGVSVQTVSRLLKTELGLLAQWQQARYTAQIQVARGTWQRTIARHPLAIIKELRGRQPSCYAWLYRHDRPWLFESLMHVPKYQHTSAKNVNWDHRDIELVNLISATVRHLKSQSDTDITLQQIYQSVPKIKPYLSKLKRLPLTRQLLEQVCCRSFASKHNPSK